MKKSMYGTVARCALSAALAVGVLAGCSRPQPAGDGAAQQAAGLAISIKGSDTMVHLVSDWAEAYMSAHPEHQVSVTGGGSGTGVAALLNGTTDICMSSRDLSEDERAKAAAAGIAFTETSVALDGLSVVVHPENPVNELTLEDIEKIFTGEYTNWQQVGGPDMPIQAVSRESSSGTFVFFQEHVLKKKNYAPSTMLLPATSAIVQSVAADTGNIGYVGLGYAESAKDRIKEIAVKADAAAPAVLPSVASVKSGEYSIARPLYLFVTGNAPDIAKSFVEFCLSPEGQAIAAETGYVPV